MELKKVKSIADIKKGDTVIITGEDFVNEPFKVSLIKNNEIILDSKKNVYFNIAMYFCGQSWVKDVGVII